MKLKLKIILFFSFLIFSCSNKENDKKLNSTQIDSVSYYYNLSKSGNLNDEKKLIFLNKALENINYINNSKSNRDKLADITFDFYRLNKLNEFNKSSGILLNKSLLKNDSVNIGKALRCKAMYFKNFSLDSSLIFYIKAEKIYKKLNDPVILGNVILNKGLVQYEGGDFLGAELSLSTAYSIFKESDEKEKFFSVLNQLGLTYNELKEYDKAIFYQNKALETVQKYDLITELHEDAVCYNNLGYLYIKLKKYKEAIYNLELGLKDKNIIKDDPDLYSLLIDNLAYSRFQSSNFKDLPELFFEALEIRERLNNSTGIVASYIHLSEFFQYKGDNDKAIFYGEKAVETANISKLPVNIILSLKQAAIVDPKNSLKYSRRYIALSDSLQVAERKSKDRFARIQLETDEIIQQNDKLADKNRNLLYFFFGTVGLFGLLYFIRVQRTRTRELLYKQAQQKANEEIFNLMMSQQAIIDESRTQEKQKLARELHDSVLGRMFGIRLSLDSVNQKNDENAALKRTEIINELKTIEQDIREISHDLNREKQVLINNFASIVNKLIEEQKEKHKSEVSCFIDETIKWDKIGSAIKINLYRILQESLQNINKYANAKSINIGFIKDENDIILKIIDDGSGFDTNKKNKGIGTQNMISRTKECNGTIDIHSEIGEGTTITVIIPIMTENKTQP